MKEFFKEFKEFISRGNVLDMAIGVVIGSAFANIVSSLVDHIIMPLVGMLVGGQNFSGLSITFKSATIHYGLFIQNIVDFLIVAFCIFLVVKTINKMQNLKKKKEEVKEEPAAKAEDIVLLEEIRDLLKKQNKKD